MNGNINEAAEALGVDAAQIEKVDYNDELLNATKYSHNSCVNEVHIGEGTVVLVHISMCYVEMFKLIK